MQRPERKVGAFEGALSRLSVGGVAGSRQGRVTHGQSVPRAGVASEALPVATTGVPEMDPRLLVWLSASFPVGAFAYSHGLELAVDRGWLRDRDALAAWLEALVSQGSLGNDLILLAAAHRATVKCDPAALASVNELALALQPSAERHLETVTQGHAFVATIVSAWPVERLGTMLDGWAGDTAYPVAVGLCAGAHGVALGGALAAYGISFVGNLVSAAIRLSVVGQTDGQRVIAGLMPVLAVKAETAATATLADVGGSTLRSDLASLAHETQYSRLFRS